MDPHAGDHVKVLSRASHCGGVAGRSVGPRAEVAHLLNETAQKRYLQTAGFDEQELPESLHTCHSICQRSALRHNQCGRTKDMLHRRVQVIGCRFSVCSCCCACSDVTHSQTPSIPTKVYKAINYMIQLGPHGTHPHKVWERRGHCQPALAHIQMLATHCFHSFALHHTTHLSWSGHPSHIQVLRGHAEDCKAEDQARSQAGVQ